MKVKRLYEEALLPTKATEGSAAFDLYAYTEAPLEPGETFKYKTGVALEIPEGRVGLIFPRSGLSTKFGIRLSNCVGVIDSDYRGEIIVALHNDSYESYMIYRGDRIAQLMIVDIPKIEIEEVAELSDTKRGIGGFGSSGK